MIETIRVQLNFPIQEVAKPVIWHLAHDFGLQFSIRQAQIHPATGGYTILELTGESQRILDGLAWAQSEGVEISTLPSDGTHEWVI